MEDSEKFSSVEEALEAFRKGNMHKVQELNSLGITLHPMDIVMARIEAIVALLSPDEQAAVALQYEQLIGQGLSAALVEARKATLAQGASLSAEQVDKLAQASGIIVPGR